MKRELSVTDRPNRGPNEKDEKPRDPIYFCESFVLEEWLSLCSHRSRQRFQLYLLSVLADFYPAEKRTFVKFNRYNRLSHQSERQEICCWRTYRFLPTMKSISQAVSQDIDDKAMILHFSLRQFVPLSFVKFP